jgi:hypothetical protein
MGWLENTWPINARQSGTTSVVCRHVPSNCQTQPTRFFPVTSASIKTNSVAWIWMSVHTSASCRHFVTTRRSNSMDYNNNNNNNNNNHKWRFDIQQTRTVRCSLRQCTNVQFTKYVHMFGDCHHTQNTARLRQSQPPTSSATWYGWTYMLIHNSMQTNPGTSNGPLILSLVPYSVFRGERWTIHAICMFYQFLSHLKTQRAGKLRLKSDNRSDTYWNEVT